MSTAPTPTGTDSPISNNDAITPVTKSRLKEFTDKVAPYTTILGAVNDIFGLTGVIFSALTIVSTLLFVQSVNESPTFIFTQNPITADHMIGLWFITAYAYFGLTRKAYNQAKEQGFSDSYTKYFTRHILIDFKKPWLSILFSVLVLVFIITLSAASQLIVGAFFVFAIVFSIIGAAVKFSPTAIEERDRSKQREKEEKRFNDFIANHWASCEKLIAEKLSQNDYISFRNLNDLATVHELNRYHLEYIIAKYATTYPRRAKYGFFYWRFKDANGKFETKPFSSEYKGVQSPATPVRVLVSMKYYNECKEQILYMP